MSTKRSLERAVSERPNTSSTRTRFGRWYRGRPFFGGLLIVLAGIEIILSSQLDLGNIQIQVGIEGMQAMILPIALMTLGALIVAMPTHRIFYGVMALAFSIYALVGVNLGGFLIGTLIGIVGGVLSVSWMPRHTTVVTATESRDNSDDLDLDDLESLGLEPLALESGAAAVSARRATGSRAHGLQDGVLAIVAVAVLVGATFTGFAASPSFAESTVPIIEPTAPSGAPAPTAPTGAPAPTPTADPPLTPVPTPGPDLTPSPTTSPAPEPPISLVAPIAEPAPIPLSDPDALTAAAPSARLQGASVTLEGAHYLGTVSVARADGTVVVALKITADRVMIRNFSLDSTDPGAQIAPTSGSAMTLTGQVTIFCSSLAGDLADGSRATFDASTPPPSGIALPSLNNASVGLVTVLSQTATMTGGHLVVGATSR